MFKKVAFLFFAVVFALTACGPAAAPTVAPPTAAPPTAAPPTAAPPTAVPPTAVPPTAAPVAAPTSAQSTSAQVTIKYAFWDQTMQPYIDTSVQAFNKLEPNIKVELEVIPFSEYWTKLQTAVAGGEVADVFWMDVPYYNIYAHNGVLAKLDPLIARDNVDMSVYPVNSYKGLADGQYVLPSFYNVMGLAYNKKLFDAAGVKYPTPDWTWDDLKNAAKQLTNKSAGVYGFVSNPDGFTGWWNFVAQNGSSLTNADGSKFTFDDPAGCAAIDFYTSFIREGLSPDGPTLASSDPTAIFTSGKAAMMIFGEWTFPTVAKNNPDIAVTALPKGPKVNTSYTHNMSNGMWSKSPHPEEAWKFLKFLGSQQGLGILAKGGTSIPDYKGLEQDWINAMPGFGLDQVYTQIGKQTSWPPGTMEWSDPLMNTWKDAYNGNIPWDQLCTAAAKAATDAKAAAK